MIETVISSLVSFIGTNIDDIFIDTLFFSEAETKAKARGVVVGKYLGIGLLVLISILSALGVRFLPQPYIAFLGVIPIGLGIKEIVCQLRKPNGDGDEGPLGKGNDLVWNVMLVTMANGADNIGVYVPLFAGFEIWQLLSAVCVFAVMIALWCFLGKKLSDLPFLRRFLAKYKHIIVPAIYIVIGIYIILDNIL